MVAYKPRTPSDESRKLSPETTAQLRAAIAERWARPMSSESALATALSAAAEEARRRAMRPEELLLSLKSIEEEVAIASHVVDHLERDDFRFWLAGACVRAFFSEQADSDG